MQYQWLRGDSEISGATSINYTVVQEDVGTVISVDVTSTVQTGTLTANTPVIEKADQDAPDSPTMASRTSTSITLIAVNGCEYQIDELGWQASPEFTGLTPETAYSLKQRYAETATHNASTESEALAVTTDAASAIVTIPDVTFKADLVGDSNINTNSDNEIQVSEAEAYTGEIDVAELSISDLTGIEAFVNITGLNCSQNELSVLNVSANTKLELLICDYNQFSILDISINTALTTIYCENNQLTSLDLSNNTALTTIFCDNNQLTALDLLNNTALTRIYCSVNQLTSLNLRNGANANISHLRAISNPNLNCVSVDDVDYAENNWTSSFDSGVSFSTDCSAILSNDATLSDLKVGINTIDGFSPTVFNYQKIDSYCEIMATGHVSATATNENATVNIEQLSPQNPNIATVVVTAEDGVTQLTYTITFSESDPIVIESVTPIDAPCPGEYGGFTIMATGGYGNLEYGLFLNEGEEDEWHWWYEHNAPNNLRKYDFVIKVRDENGCEELWNNGETVTFSEPELIVTADKTDVTVNGANDGTITVNVQTQGAESIEYYLSVYDTVENYYTSYGDPQASNIFENLPPGLYIASVEVEYSECNGSADTSPIEISEPSSGVPTEVSIEDEIFNSSSTECYGATQTIVVAEDGNEVRFQNASNTNLIAGQSIRFLPGTVIEPGAYVHAYITTDNSFCDALPEAIVAAPKIEQKSFENDDLIFENEQQQATIKVFPNPNNGQFTIVANGFDENALFIIYNPLGKTIMKDILKKEKFIDFSSYNKGLYIIKTINNNKILTQKILIR